MSQTRDSLSLRINGRFFYGWVMLAVGGMGVLASGPAQSHTFSVFITPIGADLGISRTAVSMAYAVATLLAALGLPYVGRLIDRFGVRVIILWVTLLFGASTIAFGFVTNLALLACGFAALRFLGQGALMLSCNSLVAQWFSRKRGFALSLTALGFSLSMALHPPLAQWLIDRVGWRETWVWLGLATWMLLPLLALLVHNKPEDLGLRPDGVSGVDGSRANGQTSEDSADVGMTLNEAMRTSTFWIIAAAVSTMAVVVTGIFFHQVSIFATQGLSPQVASQLFAVSAATMVVSMPLLGRLVDRFPTQLVFMGVLLLTAGTLISLAAVTGMFSAFFYGIVLGIANGAIHTHLNAVWPRFFGRKHLASILGVAQMFSIVGASLGPLPFAVAYDWLASYTEALIGMAILPLICAVLVLFMKAPKLIHS